MLCLPVSPSIAMDALRLQFSRCVCSVIIRGTVLATVEITTQTISIGKSQSCRRNTDARFESYEGLGEIIP